MAMYASNNPNFDQLWWDYYKPSYFFILRAVGNVEDAREIAQEVWLAVYKQILFFKSKNGASVKTWIIAIARNKICDFWRRKKLNFDSLDRETNTSQITGHAADDPVNAVINWDEKKHVRFFIKKLPRAEFEVAWLAWVEGRSYPEIVKGLKISPEALRTRLHRARNRLRGWMR